MVIVQCSHGIVATYYDIYGVGEFNDIVLSLFFMYFLQFWKYIYFLPSPFYLSPSPQFWKIIGLFVHMRCTISSKGGRSFFCFFLTCLDSAVSPEVPVHPQLISAGEEVAPW